MTRSSRTWLLLPALLALVWYWPVLSHGFRSDDFLTVYYFDRDAGAVRWGRVFEEWVRPWFGVRDLYRPVVSLTFGLNWAASTSPFGFHLLNLLLLLGTATLVGRTVQRLVPGRWALAGCAAAAVVLLHHAAVEPTAWIAARTTGLQVFFSALAYWSFVRWRDGEGALWQPLAAVALACASKEGAVLLPASLVVLDLLRSGVRGSAEPRGVPVPFWRAYLPFFALVGGYLLWRRCLLGVFTTAAEGHTIDGRWANTVRLLEQLVAPPDGSWAIAIGLVVVLVAVPRRGLWCVPWIVLLLVPGTTHVVFGGDPKSTAALAGRFLFDAVPALAVFVGIAVGASSRWRWLTALLGFSALAVGLAVASGNWITRYDNEDLEIRTAREALLREAAAAAEPGKPFAIGGLPAPQLHPELWGFLTQRPFVERDLAVVGINNILQVNSGQPEAQDVAPLYALVRDGAGAAWWHRDQRKLLQLPDAEPGPTEWVAQPGQPTRFMPPGRLSPLAAQAFEIRAPSEAVEWRVQLLTLIGGAARDDSIWTIGAPRVGQAGWFTALFFPWVVSAPFGVTPGGLDLRIDGRAPPPGTTVRAHGALPRLVDDEPFAAELPRDEFAARVVRRPRALAEERTAMLYLMMPTGVYVLTAAPGGPAVWRPAVQSQVTYVCDVLGDVRVHWFWLAMGSRFEQPARFGPIRSCVVR